MDEQEEILFKALNSLSKEYEKKESGFEDEVMKKITIEDKKRKERKETLNQLVITTLIGIGMATILLFIRYFLQDFSLSLLTVTNDLKSSFSIFADFSNNPGFKEWIIIGANLAFLLTIEQIISKKLQSKD
jgi:Fe2+ transport system protein B